MPADLLRYVTGPEPYSRTWLWVAALCLVVLALWYTVVFVYTAPGRRTGVPLLSAARDQLIKRRAAHAIGSIAQRYRRGELAAAPAGAAISGELRRFLHRSTGVHAEYMHLSAIANSELAPAAPVLAALVDAQFNASSVVDIAALGDRAEELVRTWT
ncbi:hypothetical protein SBI67_13555 [Mycolicibacterium sp. 120266]|uniref:hypothetical protein n=1 Tax=Mycolicibacterium sp. 120266 TaxID=3090601 RepID=UPI00299D9749|nr:hypothetical protein [Mycolicibacterium sp. 120266]MDX1873152.1 hypothetical protein [Mycolicibacterium sp. 120266]